MTSISPVRLVIAGGAGAIGRKHLAALKAAQGVRVIGIVDPDEVKGSEVAETIAGCTLLSSLGAALSRDDVDAVILCTPTSLHASQAIECLEAGKHVLIEIPLADRFEDAEKVVQAQQSSGKIAMCAHTRRFNPGHQWIRRRCGDGEFQLQHLVVQTFFMRRSNVNLLGEPRNWTDHLLWHHAAHSIDLFAWQCGEPIVTARALQGPVHADLGIALDMSIQLESAGGSICTISLSFNDSGPQGSTFRYIGNSGTYVVRNDDLLDAQGRQIDLNEFLRPLDGIVWQDSEFVNSIREDREPDASIARVFECYRTLETLSQALANK